MNLIDLIDELGDMTLNFYANVIFFFFYVTFFAATIQICLYLFLSVMEYYEESIFLLLKGGKWFICDKIQYEVIHVIRIT